MLVCVEFHVGKRGFSNMLAVASFVWFQALLQAWDYGAAFFGWVVVFGLRSAPHSGQNLEVAGMRVWHFGQMSTTGVYDGL